MIEYRREALPMSHEHSHMLPSKSWKKKKIWPISLEAFLYFFFYFHMNLWWASQHTDILELDQRDIQLKEYTKIGQVKYLKNQGFRYIYFTFLEKIKRQLVPVESKHTYQAWLMCPHELPPHVQSEQRPRSYWMLVSLQESNLRAFLECY